MIAPVANAAARRQTSTANRRPRVIARGAIRDAIQRRDTAFGPAIPAPTHASARPGMTQTMAIKVTNNRCAPSAAKNGNSVVI